MTGLTGAIGGGLQDLLAPYQAAIQGSPSALDSMMGQQPGMGMLGMVDGMKSRRGTGNADSNLPASHWEQVAANMAQRKYGWGPEDFRYIDWIISGGGPSNVVAESHWDPNAVNPNGGASGIPQMLPSAHPDINLQQFRSNPLMQIRWLLNYVKGRYGDPQSAYQAKATQGWY